MDRFKQLLARAAALVTLVASMAPLVPQVAHAAQLTSAGLAFGNETASTSYDGNTKIFVYFKPATALVSTNTITVTLTGVTAMTSTAADYTIGLDTITLGGATTTAAAISTTPVASASPTNTIVLTANGSMNTSTTYSFSIKPGNGKLTTPAAGNQVMNVQTSAGDNSDVSVSFVTNPTVSVTATVEPFFSLALSTTTQALGTINQTSGNILTKGSGVTVTVISNAINGWSSQIVDTNGGLKSTRDAAAHGGRTAIGMVVGANVSTTPAATSKGLFGVQLSAPSTNVVQNSTNFNTTNSGGVGADTLAGMTSTSPTEMMYKTDVSNATTGDTFVITPAVVTDAITPAANDYADTLTVIAAGLF